MWVGLVQGRVYLIPRSKVCSGFWEEDARLKTTKTANKLSSSLSETLQALWKYHQNLDVMSSFWIIKKQKFTLIGLSENDSLKSIQ